LQIIGKDSLFGKAIRGLTLSPTLCQLLQLQVGDSVALSPTPTAGKQKMLLQAIESFPLPQAESIAVLPLALAQRFAGVGKQVSSLMFFTSDLPISVKQFVITNDFTIRSWKKLLPEINQMLALLQATLVLMSIVLFVLLGMAVAVVVVQNWQERLPEMRRLRILGMTRRQVWRMLLAELGWLWGAGFLVGMLVCLPVLAYLNAFPVSLPADVGKGLQGMGFPTRLRFGWDWVVLGVPFLCIFALFNILSFIAYSFANRLKVYA
jgi:ABC-type antimicrobial peptide transport system permease subunit